MTSLWERVTELAGTACGRSTTLSAQVLKGHTRGSRGCDGWSLLPKTLRKGSRTRHVSARDPKSYVWQPVVTGNGRLRLAPTKNINSNKSKKKTKNTQ